MGSVILALDMGSGGATAARVDERLRVARSSETSWQLRRNPDRIASLSPAEVLDAAEAAVRECAAHDPPDALALSSMMHTLLVTDERGRPRTPVFTWLDSALHPSVNSVERHLGAYTKRTGAWFHPSFPAYKLARLGQVSPGVFDGPCRVHSLRSFVQQAWTGGLAEDTSTASASGLLNLEDGKWDRETLDAIGLDPATLPPLVSPRAVVGFLHASAAGRLGLPAGLPVVAGGGDGFLATLGSGCRTPDRLAITLGTTASVRSYRPTPEDVTATGLFSYRFDSGMFLHGAASNNGGNVLDWARKEFAVDSLPDPRPSAPPVFLPFVFGERAPFWDTGLGGRWLGLGKDHMATDLWASVVEGLAFMLALYSERVGQSGPTAMGVLSGNGFQTPGIARIFASLVPFPIRIPQDAGMATLRGAALLALEALGVGTGDAAEALIDNAHSIEPLPQSSDKSGLDERLDRFRKEWGRGEPARIPRERRT